MVRNPEASQLIIWRKSDVAEDFRISSQMILFHQTRIPFPLATFWGPRSCEVAIIWPFPTDEGALASDHENGGKSANEVPRWVWRSAAVICRGCDFCLRRLGLPLETPLVLQLQSKNALRPSHILCSLGLSLLYPPPWAPLRTRGRIQQQPESCYNLTR